MWSFWVPCWCVTVHLCGYPCFGLNALERKVQRKSLFTSIMQSWLKDPPSSKLGMAKMLANGHSWYKPKRWRHVYSSLPTLVRALQTKWSKLQATWCCAVGESDGCSTAGGLGTTAGVFGMVASFSSLTRSPRPCLQVQEQRAKSKAWATASASAWQRQLQVHYCNKSTTASALLQVHYCKCTTASALLQVHYCKCTTASAHAF